MMHLSMCLLQLLACCLPAWVVLIIRFIIRSNVVLNCELGQASPHQMFYIALQLGVTTWTNKQVKVDKRISSVGGLPKLCSQVDGRA